MGQTNIDRWTSGADYDQWMGRWSQLVAREFVKWLNLPAGLRWIDVCCGSGVISQAILDHSSPVQVLGVDVSSEQISFARQHRASPNVTFETGNALALQFADSTFDVAVCGLGLNYLPNPVAGLEEFRRVTRSGGSIAVYVWDYLDGARFLREFWDAAVAIDSDAAAFDQARRFPMCTPVGLRDVFAQAKLEEPTVRAIEVSTRFANFDDYWEPLLTGQGSAPNYLATRDRKIQSAIRERVKATLPADAHGAIDLPARAWAIRARRP